MNPTPKQIILTDPKFLKAHAALVDDGDFLNSIQVAMAQYTRTMCNLAPHELNHANQLQASAMAFQRVQGAQEFVAVLLGLHEQPHKPNPRPSDNLTQ